MKNIAKIALFLHRFDKACARMNSGMTAFAAVLAVMVVFMGAIRAAATVSAAASAADSAVSSAKPILALWTYY